MKLNNRDRHILEHILEYCDQIVETTNRACGGYFIRRHAARVCAFGRIRVRQLTIITTTCRYISLPLPQVLNLLIVDRGFHCNSLIMFR